MASISGRGRREILARSALHFRRIAFKQPFVNRTLRIDAKPTNAWRPFLPVRASASLSAAISVKPTASSSSRYANNPASDVTTDPRN
jgi:hypothetical protein